MTEKEIQDFIEEWVLLYPENVKFNNYLLRSKAKDCVNKMIKLCKDNPHYTKELIFAATKKYLAEQKQRNWAYTKQATYFISKIGQPSLLAQYCDELISGKQAIDIPLAYDEGDAFI